MASKIQLVLLAACLRQVVYPSHLNIDSQSRARGVDCYNIAVKNLTTKATAETRAFTAELRSGSSQRELFHQKLLSTRPLSVHVTCSKTRKWRCCNCLSAPFGNKDQPCQTEPAFSQHTLALSGYPSLWSIYWCFWTFRIALKHFAFFAIKYFDNRPFPSGGTTTILELGTLSPCSLSHQSSPAFTLLITFCSLHYIAECCIRLHNILCTLSPVLCHTRFRQQSHWILNLVTTHYLWCSALQCTLSWN